MRWAALIAIPVALLLAGCGGTEITPTPETVAGTIQQTTSTTAAPKLPQGNAQAGKTVFASAGCSGCHTLKAAGASGSVGPNLDQLQLPLERIQTQVLNGGATMPAFKGTLSDQQIADVAQFVYQAQHGG